MTAKAAVAMLLAALLALGAPNGLSDAVERLEPVFSVSAISAETRGRIEGVSWKEGCPVPIEDLRLVSVTYVDFGRNVHVGEIVAHKNAADDLADIFRELYEARFPIEHVSLVDDYGADDGLSMAANNTSAFNYRTVSGSSNLSRHAYGMAIDINPVHNPYVEGDYVSPAGGRAYLNRSDARPGMVTRGGVVYKAFTSRGWTWGGDWKYQIDYQHFQKSAPS